MVPATAILTLQSYAKTLEMRAAEVGKRCRSCGGVHGCSACKRTGLNLQLSTELEHLQTMIPKAIQFFYDYDRREKAMRWLGFIQGVLYCERVYTISEMKLHNAPPGTRVRRSAD